MRACTEDGIAVEVASEGSGGNSVRVSMCVERPIGVCFVSGCLAATGVIVWKTCGSSRSDSRPSRPDYCTALDHRISLPTKIDAFRGLHGVEG